MSMLRERKHANRFNRRNQNKRGKTWRKRALHSETLERRDLLAGDMPIITEFLAVNNASATDGTGILDQFGASSDWIEIFNPTTEPSH